MHQGQHQQQQQQQQPPPQHQQQQYYEPRQRMPSTTPSGHGSPSTSSYALSDSGGEDFTISSTASAPDMAVIQSYGGGGGGGSSISASSTTPAYRHTPYAPLPSVYVTAAPSQQSIYTPHSSYLNPNSTAAQYSQLPAASRAPRPRRSSRTPSYGYAGSSRSHSSSLSPSPHSSPAARQANLSPMAAPPPAYLSSSLGSGGNNPYLFPQQQYQQHQQHQQQQQHQHQQRPQRQHYQQDYQQPQQHHRLQQSVLPAIPIPMTTPAAAALAPVVRFPSQFLPSHPALAAFRTSQRPGWAERLSQRTVDRLVRPYRRDASTAGWGTLGVLPQEIIDRIFYPYRNYKFLIKLRTLSRGTLATVDPQRASRDDKYEFVREREDKIGDRSRRRGAGGAEGEALAAGEAGLPLHAACFFCYSVKSTRLFQSPREQRHWVIVHVDPHTQKVSYTPINDDDEASASSRRSSYDWQQQQQQQQSGGYGQPEVGGMGGYGQQLVPQQPRARMSTPVNGTKISLPRYCMECGVRDGLHIPGELYRTWASEGARKPDRRVWICECVNVPPRDRIHDLIKMDYCERCSARASFR